MAKLTKYLKTKNLAPALPDDEATALAAELQKLCDSPVYPRSITASQNTLYFLTRQPGDKRLGILSAEDGADEFEGDTAQRQVGKADLWLTLAPLTAANAAALRSALPFLAPQPLGLRKSAGCGDRLGLATPGHLRAIRQHTMAPILAQQSMRENARTGRTPQQVVDDAMWGVFQEGWRDGYGADADHLKTTSDVELCAAAGYTFYTIDPGDHVDDSANTASLAELGDKVDALPWQVLSSSRADMVGRLAGREYLLNGQHVQLTREELLRAAAKYGRAVAHTVVMYRHLAEVMGERPFELEMSVDETDTITSLAEHIYIVNELKRLEVVWVSLAPRYVGTFEKGVDFIGDLNQFAQSFQQHAAVAKLFGPYKLSLHSGSDKFSVYPIAAKLAGELVHLKTAGTSYLEALRAIARLNPALFREITAFALERYPTDRATYHVSAEVEKVPALDSLDDGALVSLLDDFHAREVLHVTFGSVLNHEPFRQPFFETLRQNEETYADYLEAHFHKHLAPFD